MHPVFPGWYCFSVRICAVAFHSAASGSKQATPKQYVTEAGYDGAVAMCAWATAETQLLHGPFAAP